MCLLYCVAAALWGENVPKSMKTEAASYSNLIKRFNISDLQFPLTSTQDFVKFTKQNSKLGFNINVFKLHNLDTYNTFKTRTHPEGRDIVEVNVLLISGEIWDEQTLLWVAASHYVLITNLNSFTRKQYSYSYGSSTNQTNICKKCTKFKTRYSSVLKKHYENCNGFVATEERCPREGENFVEFSREKAKFAHALIGYGDIETLSAEENVCPKCKMYWFPRMDTEARENFVCPHTAKNCGLKECKEKDFCPHLTSQCVALLKPVAHRAILYKRNGEIFDDTTSCGDNAVVNYLQHLLDIEDSVTEYISQNIPRHQLTEDQQWQLANLTNCPVKKCHVKFCRDGTNVS